VFFNKPKFLFAMLVSLKRSEREGKRGVWLSLLSEKSEDKMKMCRKFLLQLSSFFAAIILFFCCNYPHFLLQLSSIKFPGNSCCNYPHFFAAIILK
jgi:hypothetical protein